MTKIAILLATDEHIDKLEGFPEDSEFFERLLLSVSNHFLFTIFRVQAEEFPSATSQFDGFIITGSSASVNDESPWLPRLFSLVRDLHAAKVPLFGCCFGHQVVAKALGGEVSANSFGWSVGTEVTEWVHEEPWIKDCSTTIPLYSAHQESVSRHPPTARIVGTNHRTPIAAMAIGESIFTTQYHPEFLPDFMSALIESMQAELGQAIHDSRKHLHRPVATESFASCLAGFFRHGKDPHHDEIDGRAQFAGRVTQQAGDLARQYFGDIASLKITSKGIQDLVSDADQAVEQLIRNEITTAFPDDGIIGEEFGKKDGQSGFDWVIDPIDGTGNFVRGIPAWTVVVSCIHNSRIVIGSILDPVHNEHFFARRHFGAFLNGEPIRVSGHKKLSDGLMGLGTSSLNGTNPFPALVKELFGHHSLFVKSGSGALSLAYAACGRYLAYMEDHMKSWDCLAGILLAEEAGAIVHGFDFDSMLKRGSRVIVATPGVFHQVRSISQKVLE